MFYIWSKNSFLYWFLHFISKVVAELRKGKLKHRKCIDDDKNTVFFNGEVYENIPPSVTKKIGDMLKFHSRNGNNN